MNKEEALKIIKVLVWILFLLSAGALYHYESNIVGHYESNTEAYETDTQKITTYLDRTGCSSVGEVSEEMNFGHLQARYLMSRLSKERMILKYPNRGICLSFQGEVESSLQKNQ